MRILIEGENLKYYLAKLHESFRTGLEALFDVRHFGKGYPGYWPAGLIIRNYQQIIRHTFPEAAPDLLLAECNYPINQHGFKYAGLAEVDLPKAVVLADYWVIAEKEYDDYINLIQRNDIKFILSYFIQPIKIWVSSAISNRFIFMPPSIDPRIFNDWKMPKTYDVGFLAAGTVDISSVYPERHLIHQKLLNKKGIKYLWARHPGWKRRRSHPLVGANFSRAINSCKIFVTTGGIYRNAQPKIFEALASHTLLMSDEPVGAELIGLQDGVNYVKICESDILDKIDYYLAHTDLCDDIAEAGYKLALERHTCYARALDFYNQVFPRM